MYIFLIQLILLFADLRILVVGSSIIRTAFCQKRHSIFQTHLELERHLATIFSQGKVGMKWGGGEIMRKTMSLLKVEDSSNILVLHFRDKNIPDNKDQQHLGHFGQVVPDTVLV